MKLVIQRVSEASVAVDGKVVGQIEAGLFVLVGIAEGDDVKTVTNLAEKLLKLRIMQDPPSLKATEGRAKMNSNVVDVNGSILVVSQFTLLADTTGGNRPSFIKAAKPELAEKLYNHFISLLSGKGIDVKTGQFGSYMHINVKLDGPVTITLNHESIRISL